MFQNLIGSVPPPPPPPPPPHPASTAGPATAAALSHKKERRVKPLLLTIRGPLCSDSHDVWRVITECCSQVDHYIVESSGSVRNFRSRSTVGPRLRRVNVFVKVLERHPGSRSPGRIRPLLMMQSSIETFRATRSDDDGPALFHGAGATEKQRSSDQRPPPHSGNHCDRRRCVAAHRP